ncbi:hypothetical protein PC128_g8979 [Phytophthora cactorum]|nr:hypothetical protein PC128_g8979 [Phytophthora cactorum]
MLWGEAMLHMVTTMNMLPTKLLGTASSYKKLYGRKPPLSTLRTCGCIAHMRVSPESRQRKEKLELRAYCSVAVTLPRARAPGQTPPVSLRYQHEDEDEEKNENGSLAAAQLVQLEEGPNYRQVSTQVLACMRSAFRPIPRSAVAPAALRPARHGVMPHTMLLRALGATNGLHPLTTKPVVKLPPPIEGWQPLIQHNKNVLKWVLPFIKLHFQRTGAKEC